MPKIQVNHAKPTNAKLDMETRRVGEREMREEEERGGLAGRGSGQSGDSSGQLLLDVVEDVGKGRVGVHG